MHYKKIIFTIILCFSFIPITCFAEDINDIVDITPILNEVLEQTDLSSWQNFITDNEYFNAYSNTSDPKQFIINLINGKETLSFEKLINTVFDNFVKDLKVHSNYALIIAVLALISILLEKLSCGIFSGKVSSITLKLIFISAIAVIIKGFALCMTSCIDGIKKMTDFVNSIFPVFTVLISAVGSNSASQVLQPSAALSIGMISNVICNIIMPLLTASCITSMCHCISDQKTFLTLSGSIKNACNKTIGIIFTVFLGFVSIQKLTTSALDIVSLRTIRYTLSSFSAYGGAFLSKSFDIITGCAVMLKNIIGGVGMIILLTLCLTPAIKLLCASVIYGIVSFMISLTGESRISTCMSSMGKIYGTMFLCTLTCAMLFFIIISLISSIGNTVIGV